MGWYFRGVSIACKILVTLTIINHVTAFLLNIWNYIFSRMMSGIYSRL